MPWLACNSTKTMDGCQRNFLPEQDNHAQHDYYTKNDDGFITSGH